MGLPVEAHNSDSKNNSSIIYYSAIGIYDNRITFDTKINRFNFLHDCFTDYRTRIINESENCLLLFNASYKKRFLLEPFQNVVFFNYRYLEQVRFKNKMSWRISFVVSPFDHKRIPYNPI